MDRITESLLASFVESHQLQELDESEAFERFVAYALLTPKIFDSVNSEDVAVGADSTPGIDSLAIVVNGTLVPTVDDLDALTTTSGHLEADYYFIQSKTSASFNGALITDFAEQVKQFFADGDVHASLSDAKAVSDKLLTLGARLRRNPDCYLYYVTTGRWVNDAHLVSRLRSAEDRLQDVGIFSTTLVSALGGAELQRLYRATQNRVAVQFTFRDKTTLPQIEGVDQSYLGYLPAEEFLKIIEDENGDLRRGIFEDNVRDFQGASNEVNQNIAASAADAQDRFVVLNNGVTIVARQLTTRANDFTLEDFQIVNGCQTSNVLHEQRSELGNLSVPVRIVVTQSDEIANSITAATNSQSKVTKEDLYALLAFQRKLEEFFDTFEGRERLYYERRSRQYDGNDAVARSKVVTRAQLVKSFASVYLDEPHRATRYYSTLYSQVGDRMFGDDHALSPYYASAVALHRLESFFKTQSFLSSLRPARYHVLYAVRYLAVGPNVPLPNSRQATSTAERFSKLLWRDDRCLEVFRLASEVVLEAREGAELTRDFTKQPSFTQKVRELALAKRTENASASWRV